MLLRELRQPAGDDGLQNAVAHAPAFQRLDFCAALGEDDFPGWVNHAGRARFLRWFCCGFFGRDRGRFGFVCHILVVLFFRRDAGKLMCVIS